MPFQKTCPRCNTTYEWDDTEGETRFFYRKGSWHQKVCKVCVRLEHQEKYKDGKYDYYNKDEDRTKYDRQFVIGYF